MVAIFRPSILVPFYLLGAMEYLAILVFLPIFVPSPLGEQFNTVGLISAAGLSVTAWIHFLHRRKIWEDSLKKENRQEAGLPEAPDAEFDAPTLYAWFRREMVYIHDYLNLMRALRDRKRDRIIAANETATRGKYPLRKVHATIHFQDKAKAVNFLVETYRKPPHV